MIGGSGTTLGDVRDAVLPISQRSGEMGSQRVAVQKGSCAKLATLPPQATLKALRSPL